VRLGTRLLLVGAGALAARGALAALRRAPHADVLERTNHRGRTVSLAAGPALAAAAAVTSAAGAAGVPGAAAALTAGLGAGAVGLYDDIVGARPDQKSAKGFRGHLNALRDGRVTSGLVKIAGIGVAGLVATALSGRRHPVDLLLGTGVVAGTANLVNLLDLRPGRALKVGVALGVPLAATPGGAPLAGPVAAAAALLPDDLDERVMLGDAGANALGALLGLHLVNRTGRVGQALLLAALAGLTLASEKVSFTKVIEATPGLREVDAWGRRPAGE